MFEIFTIALFGTVLSQAAPGPNLMAVASAGLTTGRKSAVAVAGGVASGVIIWVTLVALGLGAFIKAYPISLVALKILGGGYLIYLGLRALRAAWRGQAVSIRNDADANGSKGVRLKLGLMAAWRRGLLVVLTNPKAAIMWAAVASYLFGSGLKPGEVLAFAPIGALSAFLIYGTYGVLFSTQTAVSIYARAARGIEFLFGVTFGAIGGKLVWDGVRELRS